MSVFEDIKKQIKKAKEKVLSSSQMKNLAQEASQIIKERTRKGFGVDRDGGRKRKLAPLKPSTKKSRRRLKKKGLLHKDTTPAKSNLTRKGYLLDALYGKKSGKGKGKVLLKPNRKGENITNDEVAFFVSGMRPFAHLSNDEIKKMTSKSAKNLERSIIDNIKFL